MKFLVNSFTGRHDRVGLEEADGDLRYLKLNQTTPQYITNGKPVALDEPSMTYSSGVLTRIDYPNGYYKEFSYNLDGTLNTVDFNGEYTKTMAYSSGQLTGITVT